jgi:hypothetical protein
MLLIKAHSQAQTFQTRVGFQGNVEIPGNVIAVYDGGYAACGGVSLQSGGPSAFLVKVSESGQVIWKKTYRYNNLVTYARQVVATADSGFILMGNVRLSTQNEDILLIKTDSVGDLQWARTYGNSANDYANAIERLPSGNFIVSGTSVISTARAMIMRIDSSGNVLETRYTTSAFASPAIKARISGPDRVSVSGTFTTQLFTDTSGNYTGQVDIQMAGSGNTTDALVSASGRCVSVGNMDIGAPTGEKAFMLLSDSMGSTASVNNIKIGVQGALVTATAVVDPGDGTYVMAGHISGPTTGSSGFYLAKMDSSANLIWSRRYFPVSSIDYAAGTAAYTADGGYILQGLAYSGSQSDLILIKTDSAGFSGCNESSQVFNITAPLYFAGMELGPFTGPAITGTPPTPVIVTSSSSPNTVWCTSTSLEEDNTTANFNIFPNPVSHENLIHISGALAVNCSFRIFDANGKVVSKGQLHDGKTDVSGLPSGLYILEVSTDTRRFAMQRFMKL